MIKVEYAGLINLIEGREVVPELIQDDAASENIAQTVFEMMKDPAGLEKLRNDLLGAVKKLGGAGASERTADIAMGLL